MPKIKFLNDYMNVSDDALFISHDKMNKSNMFVILVNMLIVFQLRVR